MTSNKMKNKFLILSILSIFGAITLAQKAEAATLFVAPPSSQIGAGEKMTLDLKVDGEGVSINAAQAVIRFPKETLEVISLDKTDSALSFWLEEPTFSNTDGIISFTGGTPYGVSGGSIQILKIVFTAKGSGSGTIILGDAAITASDGSGTNILSKTVDAAFVVVPKRETPLPPQLPAPTPLPEPQQIIRKPVPTGRLPIKPVIKIPLYPDESQWYNVVSQFTASWDLPLDVTGISTAVNKQPSFSPGKSEGLFDNKTFAALPDGTWYLHTRFRNDAGWGPAAHYRLAVDTQSPLGFEITALDGEATDNPAATLQFKTSDALSGLKEYQVRIGDGDLIKIPAAEFGGSFKLPLQTPGERQIVVRATDLADNGIEDSFTLKTIPITSPTITFVTRELFSDEEKGLTVKGAAVSNNAVLLKVYREEALIAEGTAHSDEKGNWEFTFDQAVKNGDYKVTAQSQDGRGALSLVVESPLIKVKSKPIIQIGALQLGKGGAAILLLLIVIFGFGGGIWFYKKRQEKLAMRVSFTESEIEKIFQLFKSDVDELKKAMQTPTTSDDDYAIKRLEENIKKMELYLKRGVEKIKK